MNGQKSFNKGIHISNPSKKAQPQAQINLRQKITSMGSCNAKTATKVQPFGGTPRPKKTVKMFASYSKAYRAEDVKKVVEYLKTHGFEIWQDAEQAEKGIDEAEVVLIFLTESYFSDGTSEELQYAAKMTDDSRRSILVINLQPGNYQQSESASSMINNYPTMTYNATKDTNTNGREISKRIQQLLNNNALPPISNCLTAVPTTNRFDPIQAPKFPASFDLRTGDEENKLIQGIVEICNNPGKAALVLAGDAGVGKTTLLSRILHFENVPYLLNQTIAFWLNCYQFKEKFDDFSKKAFDKCLVDLAKSCDPTFPGIIPSEIFPFFTKKKSKRVLFILDDIQSVDVVQHFFQSQSDLSLLSCCLVVKSAQELQTIKPLSIPIKVEKLEPLSDNNLKSMLENNDQLANFCFGLPLIASLMKSQSTDSLVTLLDDSTTGSAIKVVERLVEFILDKLSPEVRLLSYSFLFFEPGQSISMKDIELFFRESSQLSEAIRQFESASLLQLCESANSTGKDLYIHQLVFEGLLKKAIREFGVANGLQEIRVRLVTSELKEMLMFETIRKHRLSLLQRFATVFDAENLANLLKSQSLQPEDKGRSFLHILYHATWPGVDSTYPEGDSREKFGVNNSYRIIRAILMRLRQTVSRQTIFEVVNLKSQDGWSFLHDLIEDDVEEVESQRFDRQSLISLVSQWRGICAQELWEAAILSGQANNPLLLPIAKKDFETFKEIYVQLATSTMDDDVEAAIVEDNITEAVNVASRCGCLEILKFLLVTEETNSINATPMIFACVNGHFEVVKFLAEKDASLATRTTKDGLTPLMMAAAQGHSEVVQFLTKVDAKMVSQPDDDGNTAMILAAEQGHLDVVKILIEKQPNLMSQANKFGKTPIMGAAMNGHLDVVKFLVSKDLSAVSQTSNSGAKAIFYACQGGQLEVVEFLADKDPRSLAERDNNDLTLMMASAGNGHLEVVRFLAEIDPDSISFPTRDSWTPMTYAAQAGHLEVVKFLAAKEPALIKQPAKNGFTPLMATTNLDIADYITEVDPKTVVQVDHHGSTALWLAARNGSLDFVKLFAEKEPTSISMANKDKSTPISIATRGGHVEIVKFLASKDPTQISQADCDGWTPMLWACQMGKFGLVKFLAETDPQSVSHSSNVGWTPILLACEAGSFEVVRFLAEKDPSSVAVANKSGNLPIHLAAAEGHLEIVKLLASKDPQSVFMKNNTDETPKARAAHEGHMDVEHFLAELMRNSSSFPKN